MCIPGFSLQKVRYGMWEIIFHFTLLFFMSLLNFQVFLAHLSRRLTRWAYSIPYSPSVVRSSTISNEYLYSQLANLNQILCVASLVWGKGCIRFWGRLDPNSGLHGNRKPPLTYKEENDISTFSRLFLIRSFLYLQVTRTCIKSRGEYRLAKPYRDILRYRDSVLRYVLNMYWIASKGIEMDFWVTFIPVQ